MFDQRLARIFQEAGLRAFTSVPELRSVMVVFDYYGALGSTDGVIKSAWLGPEGGASKSPATVLGTATGLINALSHVLDQGVSLRDVLAAEYERLLQEIKHASQSVPGPKGDDIRSDGKTGD